MTGSIGLLLAFGFAILMLPVITLDRWIGGVVDTEVVAGQPAPVTVRVPAIAGLQAGTQRLTRGGIVIARGDIATAEDAARVRAVTAETPRGPLPSLALLLITFAIGALVSHHLRRSPRGRLVRVQVVSFAAVVLLAIVAKLLLVLTTASMLVVPVALLSLIATLALDRVVGIATGVLGALIIGLLGPFDVGSTLVLLAQAVTAGIVVTEQPKARWQAVVPAGLVAIACSVATYVLLVYLTTGALPVLAQPLGAPWFAALAGPLLGALLAVALLPGYQRLVGEITRGKLLELESPDHPLRKLLAVQSRDAQAHARVMANLSAGAANAIGANPQLARVGAAFQSLGTEAASVAAARTAGLHDRIIDFMRLREPGELPQTRETALLVVCEAVEAATRGHAKRDAATVQALVQETVYGTQHLGVLDESGLSMRDMRLVSDILELQIAQLEPVTRRPDQAPPPSADELALVSTQPMEQPVELRRRKSAQLERQSEPQLAPQRDRRSDRLIEQAIERAIDLPPPSDPAIEIIADHEILSDRPAPIAEATPPVDDSDARDASDASDASDTIDALAASASWTEAGASDAPWPELRGEPSEGVDGLPLRTRRGLPSTPPELITPELFTGIAAPTARKRAATLPPTRLGRAPTVPPLNAPTRRPSTVHAAQRAPAPILDEDAPESAYTDATVVGFARISDPDMRRSGDRISFGDDARQTLPVDGDAALTAPSMPAMIDDAATTHRRIDLPLKAPPSLPPPERPSGSLASRIDAQRDEWSSETPVRAPSSAELRSLLGQPDPTRQQSVDELERLHANARGAETPEIDVLAEPPAPRTVTPRATTRHATTRRPPVATAEVDPDDIEAAIEIHPPAKRPSSVGIAKPKKD